MSNKMDTVVLFRERLKQLILERYPSLDRFYLESGVSKGHVSEILRGVSSPSVATLIKLADALEIEVKDFFVFPEENPRHRAIAWLESAPEETVSAVLETLGKQQKTRARRK